MSKILTKIRMQVQEVHYVTYEMDVDDDTLSQLQNDSEFRVEFATETLTMVGDEVSSEFGYQLDDVDDYDFEVME